MQFESKTKEQISDVSSFWKLSIVATPKPYIFYDQGVKLQKPTDISESCK